MNSADTHMKSSDIYAYHMARMWPDRNDERVSYFANGERFDRDARRASIRQNLGSQRRFRARGD